jgi:ubiquitin carboxyl-terminal hydrolase 5/13
MGGATCPHLKQYAHLNPPRPSESVYREDCTRCFDSADDEAGLDVCLHCFNGGCAGERVHGQQHAKQFDHPLAVRIQRSRKRKSRDDHEPPEKMKKLEIKAETDAERYDTKTELHCFECGVHGLSDAGQLDQVVQGVLKANTFAQQEEVKAWELELQPCDHTIFMEQEPAREIPSGALSRCNDCELNENLWLCLTCGNLGCGRRQFGGSGGNNHGVDHTTSSGHAVAVKLGSLTADGNADIYCYQCDEERTDPKLVAHLANWGIDIASRVKTEKSLAEQQLEQNLHFDFAMTDADGRQLRPLFGPGLTGLKNLGNSCYLASVLQALFSMPEFEQRYLRHDEPSSLPQKPAEDLEIQLRKLADGLLTGRYSKPDTDVMASGDVDDIPHQRGLAPAMLKHLIGRGHAEFASMRQQDSFELLLHILKLISRSQQSSSGTYSNINDPVDAFRFVMEQKLTCLACKKVRYRQDEMENLSVAVPIRRKAAAKSPGGDEIMTTPSAQDAKIESEFESVTLEQCLDDYTAPELVELTCSSCGHKSFSKQSLFKSFPTILAINARRFEIVNWVPTKQDVPVIVGDNSLDLDRYRCKGKIEGEEELPDDGSAGAEQQSTAFVPNESGLEMLMSMGFPRVRCEKALHATGNADTEMAAAWLFEHMEDPDIDTPLQLSSSSGGAQSSSVGGAAATVVDPDSIEALGNMGFSAPQARQALKETGGDMERAVDWLFSHPDAVGDFGDDAMTISNETAADSTVAPTSAATAIGGEPLDTAPANFQLKSIVCHKGASIHAGHYVAFVRKENLPSQPTPQQQSNTSSSTIATSANATTAGSAGTEWVLYNDEKVALGGDVEEMKKFAYIYFLRRV